MTGQEAAGYLAAFNSHQRDIRTPDVTDCCIQGGLQVFEQLRCQPSAKLVAPRHIFTFRAQGSDTVAR